MNVFRISVIVLALSLIAGVVVHIRLNNWHYAYLSNQRYDQYQRLQREYSEGRLELARYQSPENLLERLKELKLPLEGFGLPTTEAAVEKKAVKPPEKSPRKNKKNNT
ncbi:MAG: hypothetical protein WC975_04885 [Phycisphaerae bacterium]